MATKPERAESPGVKAPPGLTREQRAEFRRLLPSLRDAGVKDCDQAALARYLHHWQLCRNAERQIEAHGVTIQTTNGQTQVSPHHTILRQNSELLMRWARELGCTPMGRKRLGVQLEKSDADESDLYGD